MQLSSSFFPRFNEPCSIKQLHACKLALICAAARANMFRASEWCKHTVGPQDFNSETIISSARPPHERLARSLSFTNRMPGSKLQQNKREGISGTFEKSLI